jgi:uncharacterized integral membrane protein
VRFLGWIAKLLVFVAFLSFALQNSELVRVRFLPGHDWYAPMSLVVLFFFALGALLGAIAALGRRHRQRREVAALKEDLGRSGDRPPSAAS